MGLRKFFQAGKELIDPKLIGGGDDIANDLLNLGDDAANIVPSQGLDVVPAQAIPEVLPPEMPIGPAGAPAQGLPDIDTSAIKQVDEVPLQITGPVDSAAGGGKGGGLTPFQKILAGGAAGAAAIGLGTAMMGDKQPVEMSREEFYPGYPTRQPPVDPLLQQAPMPASAPMEQIPNPKSAGAVRPSAPEIKVTEESVPKSESVSDDIEGFTNNTVQDLQNVQKQASDARFVNEIGRASELIGSSISNTKPIAQEIFTQQAKDSDKIVDSFEKRAEKEKADPKSQISAQFRDYLKKFGVNVPSSTSAEAAAKIMPYAYQKFAAKEAQTARSAETDKELAARSKENELSRANQAKLLDLKQEEMRQTRDAKASQKLTDSQTRFAETIGKAVQNKEYEKYSKLNNVKSRAQMALETPSGQRDAALVYDFVKALDPDSAVREGEISFVGGAASIPQKIRKYMISATTGQQLLPEQRKEILAIINKSAADQQKTWKSSIQPALNRAKRLGIDESLVLPVDMPEEPATIERGKDSRDIPAPDTDKEPGRVVKEVDRFAAPEGDPRVDNFMKKNGITDRNEAIRILKKAGKI